MTREEAIKAIQDFIGWFKEDSLIRKALEMAIQALEQNESAEKWYKLFVEKLDEQEPCEMTTEEYRQRMIQAFHNADTDELIAVCVLPTEKEFEHLEWLLKNHYKKEPCNDAVSRKAVRKILVKYCLGESKLAEELNELPSVTQKYGKWIKSLIYENTYNCSKCGSAGYDTFKYCPNCGVKMQESEDKE